MRRTALPMAVAYAIALSAYSQPARADTVGEWTVKYGQGILEYGINNDFQQKSYITIDDGSDTQSGGVNIYFAIDGNGAQPGSSVTFTVGSISVRMNADEGGSISTNCHICAENFNALWPLLRRGRSVRLSFDGHSAAFSLRNANKVLPRDPPKADFYR